MFEAKKLNPISFDQIKMGTKQIEVRLYDEKRQSINLNDYLEFTKEPNNGDSVRVRVVGLLRYQNFSDLINDYPVTWFGSENKDDLLKKIYSFYSTDDENKYGVLGIRIQLT